MNLFNLNFNNWPGILLALVPACLNFLIVIYILVFMPRKSVPRTFALFTLALFLWQMTDAFARMSNSAETAAAWDKIYCLGWLFVGPIGLYFSLLYTGKKEWATSSFVLILIFLPAIIFETLFKLNYFNSVYVYSGFWGWVDNHNQHPLDQVMVFWISGLVIITTIIISRFAWKHRDNPAIGRPSALMAVGIAIPTVQGVFTQVIFPVVLGIPAIPLTSAFLTFFSVAVVIALRRFQLFNVAESVNTKMLLNNMTDIVFTVALNKRITYINPHGAELMGLKTTKKVNYSPEVLFHNDKQEAERFLTTVIEKALNKQRVENLQFNFCTKSAQKLYVLITADPIYDNNILQGILVVAHNITSIKLAENELREKNLALQSTNNELESFAFVASHDMKEPLRMVSNYTQLLEKRYNDKLDDEAKEYIGFAVDGVRRMQALIRDLVTYTSIGKEERKLEILDMNILVNDVINEMGPSFIPADAVIKKGHLPEVVGSEKLLKQLISDLISNSLKFRKENVAPVIDIKAEEQKDEIEFSINDNGIGIAPEYENKVFMIFQRLNEREKYNGTGIGLTICRKIVELHGGRIWLKSRKDQGTTFYFTIPKNFD